MAGTGRRERRTKRTSLMLSPSFYDKIVAEAERSTDGNVSGLMYILLQLGYRHWTASDDISTGKEDYNKPPSLMLSGLPGAE